MQIGDLVATSSKADGKAIWAWDDEGRNHFLSGGTLGILLLIEEETRVEPPYMICSVLIEDKVLEMHLGDIMRAMNEFAPDEPPESSIY